MPTVYYYEQPKMGQSMQQQHFCTYGTEITYALSLAIYYCAQPGNNT